MHFQHGPGMAVKSVEEFIEALAKSNLLTSEQLAKVRSQAIGDESSREQTCRDAIPSDITASEATPKAIASQLVDGRVLTRWQARQLLGGKCQFFLGKYKLLDLRGEGGMGMVFKAVHSASGRVVALKVMSRGALKDKDAVTRFQREIRSAAALQHPNIAGAYDADCVKNTYFLATEYIEGRDLKNWIRNSESLPIAWSCECIRQAAVGLQHACEVGLVHRDIKPANLLVHQPSPADPPLVKIVDLGLARVVSESAQDGELTKTGQLLGSPDYIAPEQARNTKAADIRADIFSLGCTLFEMLTKRLPFPGESVMEKLMARITSEAPGVCSLRPEIPAELETIVAKMLERDPQRRFQTPGEVAASLAPFASPGQAKMAYPESPRVEEQATVLADVDSTMKEFMEALTYEAEGQTSVGSQRIKAAAQSQRNWALPAVGGAALLLIALAGLKLAGVGRSYPKDAQKDVVAPAERIVEAASTDAESELLKQPETSPIYRRERQAAEWVLKNGGKLTVAVLGFRSKIAKDGQLPDQDFNIYAAELRGIKAVDDAGLANLQGLTEIRQLDLNDTDISDEGLKCLHDATELTRLDLEKTKVTDRGLSELAPFARLEYLNLNRTRVRGEGLSVLAEMPELKDLRLTNLPLKDDVLTWVSSLKKLKQLYLNDDAQITDAGVQQLAQLAELERLDLYGLKNVTDSGLDALTGIQSLKWLRVTKTSVTDAGVGSLGKKCPWCKVER